ncbi:hypothetical protein [Burkholderia multivorans]|uniref:hypothetical protein n=1 Tax=Burkholderia multivorans TaxID=87883 RepID=UPI0009E0CA59|nr:hypothetical protein [Burkholderia multivorans]MBN6728767.1 hypothetical protein [Burkholderia multivorans]MDN8078309.1 hypothetical protein [Burkholderia multivorans]SAJ91420.1 hypothetical protein UA11_04697 [Burkholderia multivorans]
MKPISDITDPPPRPTRASFHRITDRQVEIMTATLCDAILRAGKITPQNVHEAPAHLVGAMITHVKRLNEAIEAANNPAGFDVKVTINNVGQPVVESVEDEAARIAAFGRLAR